MLAESLATELNLPVSYIQKIIHYNEQCDMRGVVLPKRVALIAQRLQNHDNIRITSRILDCIRDVLAEVDPDAPLLEATAAYLHMFDVLLRFFARYCDVHYVVGSVKYKLRPHVVFETRRSGRKFVKYEKLARIIFSEYTIYIYKEYGSVVIEGMPHPSFLPDKIEQMYSDVVKKGLVKVGRK